VIGILALLTFAQLGAGHPRLETLAILLLAIGFPTVAALLVLLLLCLVRCILERDDVRALLRGRGLLRCFRLLVVAGGSYFGTEGYWIAHQDILLGREALTLEVSQIRAANAGAG
jgi:hypothetical protein